MQRIPFGLDRLPPGLAPDDPRLPTAPAGSMPLRLNTEPLPVDAAMAAAGGHAGRVAAMKRFLRGLCGDYAPQRQRFVDCYIDCIAAHLEAHRDALQRELRQYDGLYAPEDWLWSALRPLPRAWLPAAGRMAAVDVAFWDGTRVIAIDTGGTQAPPGIEICRVTPDVLAGGPLALLDVLPDSFPTFWRGEILPRTPFRRAIPAGTPAQASPSVES